MDSKGTNTRPETSWVLENLETLRLDSQFYHSKFLNTIKTINECGIDIENGEKIASKITQGPNPTFSETGTIPCLKTRNVYDDHIKFEGCNYVTELEFKKYKNFKLLKDDILITIQGEGSIGKVNIYNSDQLAFFNRPIGLLRIKRNDIDPYFISIYLRSKYGKDVLERGISGTSGQKVLTTSYLKSIPFIIPSPEIQKYIGNKIRKAEKLRLKSKDLLTTAENILKGLLKFPISGNLYNNNAGNPSLEFKKYPVHAFISSSNISSRLDSKSYHPEYIETLEYLKRHFTKYKMLKELVENYSSGYSGLQYSNSGIPIIMTKNVTNDFLSIDNCRLTEPDKIKGTINSLENQEILFTTYGGPSIGKVDIFINEIIAICDYTILKIKLKSDYNPFFMVLLLRSKLIQNQIRYLIKGTTGITFILPKDVLDVQVPFFEIEDQMEIGQLYEESLNMRSLSSNLIKSAIIDIENLIEGSFKIKNEDMHLIDK